MPDSRGPANCFFLFLLVPALHGSAFSFAQNFALALMARDGCGRHNVTATDTKHLDRFSKLGYSAKNRLQHRPTRFRTSLDEIFPTLPFVGTNYPPVVQHLSFGYRPSGCVISGRLRYPLVTLLGFHLHSWLHYIPECPCVNTFLLCRTVAFRA